MSLPISFDPHRANRSLRISKISNVRTGNCFDVLVKTDSICAAIVQVVGSCEAADLSAIVTGKLLPSLWRCEPRSSHTNFFSGLQPRPRQPSAARAQRATARAVSFNAEWAQGISP
jgi:hypothetical protein